MNDEKSGNELAKVLWYYNLIYETTTFEQKIVCPFHQDVNPSMIVNLKENSWYCFGCGLSGDAFKFVKEMEKKLNGSNDLQACKKYIKILKSKQCSEIKLDLSRSKRIVSNKELYNQAYDYYHGLKKVNWKSIFEPEEKEAKEYMLKRGYKPFTLHKTKAKITYNNSYGLIFPMLDNGKFKGWVCRTMRKDIEKKRKYLYNEGFSRATTLVGDYGNNDYVFVVEGYMDRLRFIQNKEYNVVAILGWKMSLQQIQKLKEKGITTIISALDNDKCGKKGTEFLKKHFNVIRFSYLKGVKDPGEMTDEQFNKCIKKTMQKLK